MKSKSTFRSFLALAGSSLLAISSASADTIYWDAAASPWGTAANWTTDAGATTPDPASAPGSADDTIFNRTGQNGNITVTLDANQAAQSITFNSTGGTTFRANLAADTTARTLSIGTDGITINAGTVTIGNNHATNGQINVALGGSQTWTNNSVNLFSALTNAGALDLGANVLTIDGTGGIRTISTGGISGVGGSIIKNGSGNLLLGSSNAVSNTFDGGVKINAGSITIASTGQLGTGNTEINGGVNGAVLGGYFNTTVTRVLGAGAGEIRITGGISGFSGDGSTLSTFTLTGDGTDPLLWGSTNFMPTQFVLGGAAANANGQGAFVNNIDLNAGNRIIRSDQTGGLVGGGAQTFSGIISNGSITKEGVGTHVFSGVNTYGGGTTINAGTLRFDKITAMPDSGQVTVNTGATLGIDLGAAGDWTGDTSGVGTLGGLLGGSGGAGGSTVVYNGDVGLNLNLTANTSYSGNIANVGTSLAITKTGASALTFAAGTSHSYTGGTSVLHGQLIVDGSLTGGGAISTASSNNNGNHGSFVQSSTGVISGASSFTQASTSGSSTLFGTNTYTGNTTLTAGSLAINAAANLGNASSNLIFDGGTLRIVGTAITNIAGLGRTVTFTSGKAVGFNIDSASNTFTVEQILNQAGGAFIKDGQGTVVLNQANTYTGGTTVTGGGNLILDYTTEDNRKLGTGALNLNGGTITLKGGVASTIENLGATNSTVNAGGMFFVRDAGSVAKIRLNNHSRNAGGTISFADATIADTDRVNTNGILGGYATLGNDWAINSTGAGDGAITAFASYSAFTNTTGSATANYLLNSSDTLGGALAANTIKITNSANSQTLDLGANNLTITSTAAATLGGIIYAGGSDNLYSITGTGRIVPSGGNQELIFAVQTGTLTVDAPVGAASSSSPVTKSGAGKLVLSAANTYTGATRLNQGTLALGASNVFAVTPFFIGNATLDAATFTDSVGSLDPTAGATINFGSGGQLAFSASNSVDWTGGTLNLTGSFDFSGDATSSLRFGTNASGLTAAQLALITAPGWTGFALNASGYLTATPSGPDVTPPTLMGSNMVDDKSGGPVTVGTLVTYTVTFSEDMDASTVTADDFEDGGTSVATIGTVTETSSTSGVFLVQATPTTVGNLILQVKAGAILKDTANNELDTTSAIADNTTIIVNPSDPYLAWAGPGVPFEGDANGDGVENGVAFLLGAASPSAAVTVPTVTQSGGNLVLSNFSSRNLANRGTATLSVQHSSDLGISDPWTTVPVPEASAAEVDGVSYNITPGSPLNTVNTATISSGAAAGGKLFGRLKATP